MHISTASMITFQSTPPMQGATVLMDSLHIWCLFQSTPPMQGATTVTGLIFMHNHSFNPRPLCRERPTSSCRRSETLRYNPRPLCRERRSSTDLKHSWTGFNPRPLCRERRAWRGVSGVRCRFQSTPPMQGAT